jgi:hypothetical protein
MNDRIQIGEVLVDLPSGWFDITEDLPAGGPITLARERGSGVIQFSFARFQGGRNPHIHERELIEMLDEFASGQGFHGYKCIGSRAGTNCRAQTDFSSDVEFIRLWYVSNGQDVAMISYTTEQPKNSAVQEELKDANALVDSVEFA